MDLLQLSLKLLNVLTLMWFCMAIYVVRVGLLLEWASY